MYYFTQSRSTHIHHHHVNKKIQMWFTEFPGKNKTYLIQLWVLSVHFSKHVLSNYMYIYVYFMYLPVPDNILWSGKYHEYWSILVNAPFFKNWSMIIYIIKYCLFIVENMYCPIKLNWVHKFTSTVHMKSTLSYSVFKTTKVQNTEVLRLQYLPHNIIIQNRMI